MVWCEVVAGAGDGERRSASGREGGCELSRHQCGAEQMEGDWTRLAGAEVGCWLAWCLVANTAAMVSTREQKCGCGLRARHSHS